VIITLFEYIAIIILVNIIKMVRRNTIDHIFYHLNLVTLQLIMYSIIIILVFRLRKRFFATKTGDRILIYQIWFLVISIAGVFLTIIFIKDILHVNFGPYSLINLLFEFLGYTGILLLYEGFLLFALLRFKND